MVTSLFLKAGCILFIFLCNLMAHCLPVLCRQPFYVRAGEGRGCFFQGMHNIQRRTHTLNVTCSSDHTVMDVAISFAAIELT